MGKKKQINCDAVVICTGADVASTLKNQFRQLCPVMPVKGYTFDMQTKLPYTGMNLVFDDIKVAAFQTTPGNWRVAGFGDLAGNDTNFDTRRVRYFINIVAKTMNKEEGRLYQNLSACLRPCSPDDIPLVGALRWYPNVYLNAGLGGRATLSFATASIVSKLIEGEGDAGLKDLVDGFDPIHYSPQRF